MYFQVLNGEFPAILPLFLHFNHEPDRKCHLYRTRRSPDSPRTFDGPDGHYGLDGRRGRPVMTRDHRFFSLAFSLPFRFPRFCPSGPFSRSGPSIAKNGFFMIPFVRPAAGSQTVTKTNDLPCMRITSSSPRSFGNACHGSVSSLARPWHPVPVRCFREWLPLPGTVFPSVPDVPASENRHIGSRSPPGPKQDFPSTRGSENFR